MTEHHHAVFLDRSGNRWKRILRFVSIAGVVLSVAGALFSFSIVVLRPMSSPSLHGDILPHSLIPKIESPESAARRFIARKAREKLQKLIEKEQPPNRKQYPHKSGPAYSTVMAFYVNWDPASLAGLTGERLDKITYLVPEWMKLTPDGTSFTWRYGEKETVQQDVISAVKTHHVPIIVQISNFDNGQWQWQPLKALLEDTDAQNQLAQDIAEALNNDFPGGVHYPNCYAGINIDFEPPPADSLSHEDRELVRQGMVQLMKNLKAVLGPKGLLVTEDVVPGRPDLDYKTLSNVADLTVVMLYDQHYLSGNPGPIASQQWIEDQANNLFAVMDSTKTILGLSNAAYDWPVKLDKEGDPLYDKNGEIAFAGPGVSRTIGEGLDIAKDAEATIEMDDDLNPYFQYEDQAGGQHIVYMLDAVTAYNQLLALKGYEPCGVALWYEGSEDQSIWNLFGSDGRLKEPMSPEELQNVSVPLATVGNGEVMQIMQKSSEGHRKFELDEDGLVKSETYSVYPKPYIIQHYGITDKKGNYAKVVALTFDDGPNTRYTPKIINILKNAKGIDGKSVPATFFVVGKYAEDHQGIVFEEWNNGDEIGNHSFTHPRLSQVSDLRMELEVNATQRVIEAITGHSTRLFRPPFGDAGDSDVRDEADIDKMYGVQRYGYVTVGMNIDPNDYDHTRPGAWRDIVRNVIRDRDKGNVILLHDGGGNRDQTVRALLGDKKTPGIIPALTKMGYRFVTVTDLMGANKRAEMFPSVTGRQEMIVGFDRLIFDSKLGLNWAISILFLVAIVLGVARIMVVGPLAVIQSRRLRFASRSTFQPPVTVIIPAYNEEKVVCNTVSTVLANDYPDLRVIVVDDGSTDHTSEVVREQFPDEPRLRLITKENGGKASALNLAVKEAETEILVCVDADTVLAKDAVSKLVRQFEDPKVGAIAGNIKVGNRRNPLTVWQSIEYITSQNFDRRAYAAINSVTVIPGALGAWRKSVVEEAGGYESSTLAEDTDLTFKIRRLGYSTRSENEALAFTEAPETVSALAKQRFRWTFGVLQALWKHRRILFKRDYGAFSMFVMPAMWIYNIFFQAISSIVDVMVVLSLLSGNFIPVFTYFAVLFVLDFIVSALAFRLDREDPKQLAWLFWQRFFYRQFMYYLIIKSILAALRGEGVGWGKLQRKATADIPTAKV